MPPRTSLPLETATDHPCNSEVAVANIAPVSTAVDVLSLPQAPIIIISALHHPNDAKPRLRTVWQLPHTIINVILAPRCLHHHLSALANISMPILCQRK